MASQSLAEDELGLIVRLVPLAASPVTRMASNPMKALTLIASVIISSVIPPVARGQDHLEPEVGLLTSHGFHWEYATGLRQLLLKDAPMYHRARVICVPAFEPAWAVTLVRQDGELQVSPAARLPADPDAPTKPVIYLVEYVGAERVLGFEGEGRVRVQNPRGIGVQTARAELDAATAEAVQEVWRRMLRGVRYPEEPRLGADGVDFHFSRGLPYKDQDGGFEEGKVWTPDPESLTGALAELGVQLKGYALAPIRERAERARAIREHAERLRDRLERRKR